MKKLLLILLLVPLFSNAQVDLSIDTVFHRSGVGGHFDKGLEYYSIPGWADTPQDYSCSVTNNGSSNATNVYLRVQVHLSNSLYFESFSDSVDIPAGLSDSLFVNNAFSDWQYFSSVKVTYMLFQDSIDVQAANDSSQYILSSHDDYSKSHPSIVNGTISPFDVSDSTFSIGSIFEFYQDGTFGGIEIFVDSITDPSALVFAQAYKLDTLSGLFYWADQGSDYSAVLGAQKLCFSNPVQFVASDKILVTVGTYLQDVHFRSIKVTDSTEIAGVSWTGIVSYYDPNIGHVDITILREEDCFYSLPENESTPSFTIHPNPSANQVQLIYELRESQKVAVSVVDLSGKEVFNLELGEQLSGSQNVKIDLSGLANGTYFVNLTSSNFAVSERLIIQR
ncbi:MAG: hypothetical protein ACI857_000772 [Arenicella sp.]|jgi:hypothetical protein